MDKISADYPDSPAGMVTLILMAFVVNAISGYRISVEILVVPVTALFAFTSLRTSMPGAPAAFGAAFRLVLLDGIK